MRKGIILGLALLVFAVMGIVQVTAQTITVYMQMGGKEGDPSTLARTNGARAAAKALKVKLVEQYSGWDTTKMLEQFKQALAARPTAIVIMGHPGEDAFKDLVAQAISRGIIVTSGNNPLPGLETKYKDKGFGYAGADLFAGGYLTGQTMVAAGLKAGDHALVYDIIHQEGRRKSPEGMAQALKDAGVIVDMLDMTQDVDSDMSKAIPLLVGYLQKHPDCKAIGTQHGNLTSFFPKILKQAGKRPGQVITGGIDLSPLTLDGIKQGWIQASFDQVLYLQGYMPVLQCWLTKTDKMPGLHIDTGVGEVTPKNLAELKPLIDKGTR
jgi:simple sugar transport system substrate-binding protein